MNFIKFIKQTGNEEKCKQLFKSYRDNQCHFTRFSLQRFKDKNRWMERFQQTKEIAKKHIQKVVPPIEASNALPWVHTMISNAKRNLPGIHHSMTKYYLQNYLNEFCYKTNRRYSDNLFDRLMIARVEDAWYGKLLYKNG